MRRVRLLRMRSVRRTMAYAVIAGSLCGFASASLAGNKLPTRVPPPGGGNGHAIAKFRVGITILPTPAASRTAMASRRIAELDGAVERFSGFTVRTTVTGKHIAMDVE